MTRQLNVVRFLLPILLVGCLGESAEITKAKLIIKNHLTDGESAQFFDLTYYQNTNFVCGEVNAKNKFGGYVGKKLVAVDLIKFKAYIDIDRTLSDPPTAPSDNSFEGKLNYQMKSDEWQRDADEQLKRGKLFLDLFEKKCIKNKPNKS